MIGRVLLVAGAIVSAGIIAGWREPTPSDPDRDACGISQAVEEQRANAELERCAAQENARAQAELGMLYWGASISSYCRAGSCVVGDPDTFGLDPSLDVGALEREGRRLLEAAAALGNASAQAELGFAYLEGQYGLAPSHATALTYFRSASESGDAIAPYNLARMYFAGYGVPRSDTEAEAYLRLSAARGYRPAQCSLARWGARGGGSAEPRGEVARPRCTSVDIMRELPLIDTDETL